MLSVEEIKSFIDNDQASENKKQARLSQRYYDGEHDILEKRIFFINADGKFQEDPTKTNTRISHPFYRVLVDQTVQYILSGEGKYIKSDDPELQKELDVRFNDNEDFTAEMYDVLEGCVKKGAEYAYGYKDENGRTTYECADSLGVIEVREKDTDDGCAYVINYYTDRIDKNAREIRRIEVWDDTQTYFYCQVDDGEITVDDSVKLNPRPHTIYKKKGDKRLYYKGFGHIPFYRLEYNRKRESDLKLIKNLIDDYDVHACSLSNNLEDTNEALYVVKGFSGDNLDELMFNIKAKKHVGVDEAGGVDVQTVDIPFEARKAKMEIDEKAIYKYGFGLDTAELKDTSATVSIAIKAAYSLLDLKAHKLKIRLHQFLRKLINVTLDEINQEKGTDYTQTDVYFDFEPQIPTNEQEKAQIELLEAQRRQTEINTLLMLTTKLDNESVMQLICEQLDIDYNEIKDKLPPPEDMNDPYQASNVLDTLPTEPDDGGDVIAD